MPFRRATPESRSSYSLQNFCPSFSARPTPSPFVTGRELEEAFKMRWSISHPPTTINQNQFVKARNQGFPAPVFEPFRSCCPFSYWALFSFRAWPFGSIGITTLLATCATTSTLVLVETKVARVKVWVHSLEAYLRDMVSCVCVWQGMGRWMEIVRGVLQR